MYHEIPWSASGILATKTCLPVATWVSALFTAYPLTWRRTVTIFSKNLQRERRNGGEDMWRSVLVNKQRPWPYVDNYIKLSFPHRFWPSPMFHGESGRRMWNMRSMRSIHRSNTVMKHLKKTSGDSLWLLRFDMFFRSENDLIPDPEII